MLLLHFLQAAQLLRGDRYLIVILHVCITKDYGHGTCRPLPLDVL